MTKVTATRYSLTYLPRESYLHDSNTARFRLAKLCEKCFQSPRYSPYRKTSHTDFREIAIDAIESELGVKFGTPQNGATLWLWELFFEKISTIQILDTITILCNVLRPYGTSMLDDFVGEAKRIFSEENLAFYIDELGNVHPLIDTAYKSSHIMAIASLQKPRYQATASEFVKSEEFLLTDPPDYKSAIRAVFSANENLFKLMSGTIRLDARSACEFLSKDAEKYFENDKTQISASKKVIESFKSWINAAHFYRHAEGVEEPRQPSSELGIVMLSQGTSFLRWLAEIDARRLSDD